MKKLQFLPLLVTVLAAARADTVVLTTLETIDRKVLSKNDDFIELQVEFGTMRVPLEKVLRIEAETPEMKAAREARLRKQRRNWPRRCSLKARFCIREVGHEGRDGGRARPNSPL